MALAIGLAIAISTAIGYTYSPKLFHSLDNMLMPGSSQSLSNSSLLAQMGFPSEQAMVKITQYLSLALLFPGIGVIIYGFMARKKGKKIAALKTSENKKDIDEIKNDPDALSILKTRLAKGQITPEEFKDLSKFLK